MNSNKNLVNVYLPEELYQALITYQEQQRLEESSEAIIEILAQFFGKDIEVKRFATVEQLEVLEGKVTHLSQQVAQLCQILASATPTEAARTVPASGNEYTRPTLTAQPSQLSSLTVMSTSFEEVEDEPDEILYDFLEGS